MSELDKLHGTEILRGGQADVAVSREHARLRRIRRLMIIAWAMAAWLALRLMWSEPMFPSVSIPPTMVPTLVIVVLFAVVLLIPMWGAGRSPHVLYRPNDIEIGLNDVVGRHNSSS